MDVNHFHHYPEGSSYYRTRDRWTLIYRYSLMENPWTLVFGPWFLVLGPWATRPGHNVFNLFRFPCAGVLAAIKYIGLYVNRIKFASPQAKVPRVQRKINIIYFTLLRPHWLSQE